MAITYFYRDTTSDLTGSPSQIGNFNLLRVTGESSSQINTGNLNSGISAACWFFTEAADPGTDGTSTGEFTLELRLTIQNANIGITCHLQRYNASGVAQGSPVQSAEGQQGAGTEFLHYNWTDPGLGTWSAGDRLGVRVTFTNTSGSMNQSCRLGANLSSDTLITPFTEAPPEPVEGSAAGTYTYSGAAAGDKATVLRANTFDGGTDGVEITVANSGGGSGDAFDLVPLGAGGERPRYSDEHSVSGELSAKSVRASRNSHLRWDLANVPEVYSRLYLRFHTMSGVNNEEIYVAQGGFPMFDWWISLRDVGSGVIRIGATDAFANGGLGLEMMTTNLPENQWFRVETRVDQNPGTYEVRLFLDMHSTTPTETLTGSTPQTSTTGLVRAFANNFGHSNVDSVTHIDDFGLSLDGWLGPTGAASNDVEGSATGAYTYSGAAAGESGAVTVQGAASGDYSYSGDAAGEPTVVASAAGAYTYAGTAAGAGEGAVVEGEAAGAYTYAGEVDPDRVRNLIATPVSPTQIDLEWDAYAEATAYSIEVDDVVVDQVADTETTYEATGLDPDTQYQFRVGAVI